MTDDAMDPVPDEHSHDQDEAPAAVVVDSAPAVPAVQDEPQDEPQDAPIVAAPVVEAGAVAIAIDPDAAVLASCDAGSMFTKTAQGWAVVIRQGGVRVAGEGVTIADAAREARA